MAQGFRERIEQRAKKSLKELRKGSVQLDKVLGPLNKLVVHMIVDGLVVMNLYLLMSPGCRQAPAGPEGPAGSLSLFEARARRCRRPDPGAGTACAENPTPALAACAEAGSPVAAGARLAVK